MSETPFIGQTKSIKVKYKILGYRPSTRGEMPPSKLKTRTLERSNDTKNDKINGKESG